MKTCNICHTRKPIYAFPMDRVTRKHLDTCKYCYQPPKMTSEEKGKRMVSYLMKSVLG